MKKILLVLSVLGMLLVGCGTHPTEVVTTSTTNPSATAYPTNTPYPTFTPFPTSTETPVPTATPLPTNTPLPPQTWLWGQTLNSLYEHIYELGYAAEMTHHDEGYWYIYFDDLNSYIQADGWWAYGNSILAWAAEDEDRIDSRVDQIALYKTYLTFPTSGIDEKADKFFRKMLDEFGFSPSAIDEIMVLGSSGMIDARGDIDDEICMGQIVSGEWVKVWLQAGSGGYYVYRVDIRMTRPDICPIQH